MYRTINAALTIKTCSYKHSLKTDLKMCVFCVFFVWVLCSVAQNQGEFYWFGRKMLKI